MVLVETNVKVGSEKDEDGENNAYMSGQLQSAIGITAKRPILTKVRIYWDTIKAPSTRHCASGLRPHVT